MPVFLADLCAEFIIAVQVFNSKLWIFTYKTGKWLTKGENPLQNGTAFYKMRFPVTKRDFRFTNGILALQFTILLFFLSSK